MHSASDWLSRDSHGEHPSRRGLRPKGIPKRASGLSWIDTASKKPHLRLDPAVLDAWSSLNGAERYFALLKAWWGRASEEMIGERQGWGQDPWSKVIEFVQRLPRDGILTMSAPNDADGLRDYPGFYNLALMGLFGLLEIRAMSSKGLKGWLPEWIGITAWGRSLLGDYIDFAQRALKAKPVQSDAPSFNYELLFDPLARFERWSQTLRPLIAGWEKDLDLPGATESQPGPYLLKVSLGTRCWRRIAIGADASLHDLSGVILDAFQFGDWDHLYRFSYKDRFGRTLEVDHPYLAGETDAALADMVKVGELPLAKGMRIGFLFRYQSSVSRTA